jgi:hypothetical protein
MFFIAFSMINGVLVSDRRWESFVSEAKSSHLLAEQIVTKHRTDSLPIDNCRVGSLISRYKKSNFSSDSYKWG